MSFGGGTISDADLTSLQWLPKLKRLDLSARMLTSELSFDIDCVDTRFAPGVGTTVSGGLTVREAHLIMELAADTGKMVSCEMVEVNPVLDHENTTARLAVELLYSAFGGQIL